MNAADIIQPDFDKKSSEHPTASRWASHVLWHSLRIEPLELSLDSNRSTRLLASTFGGADHFPKFCHCEDSNLRIECPRRVAGQRTSGQTITLSYYYRVVTY